MSSAFDRKRREEKEKKKLLAFLRNFSKAMLREEADGSAVVYGIAVAPFVPVQHMQIDISTINLVGNYCFRFARERGWLQTSEELAQATPYAESDDARPLIENEGHAYHGSDSTFFFAGVEEALVNPRPHFHYPPTPTTLLACAHFRLVHVGNSSYGVFSELYTYLDGQKDIMQHLLGTFKVTTVCVSKIQRTPVQLVPSKQSLFRAIMAKGETSHAPLSKDAVRVQRLDARELLRRSGWFADAAAVAATRVNTLPQLPSPEFSIALPGGATAPLHLLAFRSFVLRETDIDFNLHVNQLVSKMLVINAFRGAVADAGCAYARLLRPGELAIRADLLLRKFRVDYVREIPMRYAAVEVYLFPLHADRVKAQFQAACSSGTRPTAVEATAAASSKEGPREASTSAAAKEDAEMMEIGFFTVGVPRDGDGSASSGKFIATVGVMSAATCFLPQTMRSPTSSG